MAARVGSLGRIRAVLAIGAIIAAMLTVAGSSAHPALAAQVCDGSGDGSSPPAGVTPMKANVDGTGAEDDIFVSLQGGDVQIVVVLSNGFTTSIDDFYVGAGTPGVAAVRDVDQDGDDEIFVLLGLAPQLESYGLYALTGCELKRLADVSGTSPSLGLGRTSSSSFSADCLAPSAAGRGVTTYEASTVTGTTYDYVRKEYRLTVDDSVGTFEWTETWVQELDGLPADDARVTYAGAGTEGDLFRCSASLPKCAGETATIVGTPIDDVVNGTGAGDVVAAGGGDDVIKARGGADVVCAGGGDDRVLLGAGNDKGLGQAGADTILGQKGNDVMKGGRGDDVINGGPGRKDKANGNAGTDDCTAERSVRCE